MVKDIRALGSMVAVELETAEQAKAVQKPCHAKWSVNPDLLVVMVM